MKLSSPQKKQSLYCRKDTFTKIAFCCLLTLIFPAANLFVSGVIQLPEFFTAVGPIPGMVGMVALLISFIRSERWSFCKKASLAILVGVLLITSVVYISLSYLQKGTPRVYYGY